MTSTKKKVGRKQKSHQCSWDNSTVDGLYHCPDGRWRITATGQKFTEADERRAVALFFKLTQPNRTTKISAAANEVFPALGLPTMKLDRMAAEAIAAAGLKAMRAAGDLPGDIFVDLRDDSKSPAEWEMELVAYEPVIWAWVREQIIKRPKYVSMQTGIEQIAYLDDLKAPEKLPSFKEMIDLYEAHAKCEPPQITKVVSAFEDFIATTKIGSVKDITSEIVVSFQDDVHGRISHRRDGTSGPISGKQQQHIFGGVKTLLRFVKNRAVAVQAISKALDNLSILKTSKKVKKVNQQPIEIAEWRRLLGKATGENLAMILLMLNGAFYLKEVVHLDWSDIDEKKMTITVNRKKTGECLRVCVLWPETVAALYALPRKGDPIFRNYTGKRLGISGAQMRFNELAELAGVPHVTGSQLRDGAFSAAVEANVSEVLCNILVGHSNGMADHYVRANPRMVAPACAAVAAHYMAPAVELHVQNAKTAFGP